jgi:hypothetical protein
MIDLSATRKISSVSTQNSSYYVGNGYEKITVTEKPGDGAYVIWYQLWTLGQVIREINSRLVVDVEYELAQTDPIPF